MRQNRKETAWKKSRKFGDVKGGRKWPKLADNIFNRRHNFLAPTEGQELPIYMVDNPSRDFFYPASVEEIQAFLGKLPQEHTDHLTHVWLRKVSKKEYEQPNRLQASFICGSGVNLIVLYPFSRDLTMEFGKKKPSQRTLKWYAAYEPELVEDSGNWQLIWTEEKLKRYYLEGLLLHEIGHKVDSYYQRFWSAANHRKKENFADNYAFYWGDKIRNEYQEPVETALDT